MGDFPSIVQQPSQIIFLLKIKLCNSIEHCLILEADHLVFLQNILFCSPVLAALGISPESKMDKKHSAHVLFQYHYPLLCLLPVCITFLFFSFSDISLLFLLFLSLLSQFSNIRDFFLCPLRQLQILNSLVQF